VDLLTIILACSLHRDPALVRAIVELTSESKQFWVGDFTDLRGNGGARNAQEAEQIVSEVRRKGHAVVVGLMGVPVEWAQEYGRTEAQLWSACVNVEVGTARLSQLDSQCRAGKRKDGRRARVDSSANRACVLRRYSALLRLPKEFLGEVMTHVYRQGNEQGKKDARGTAQVWGFLEPELEAGDDPAPEQGGNP
jgi:hypothetical protein